MGFTASAGVLVYRPGSASRPADSQLVWTDRNGRDLGTVGEPGAYRGLQLSPDDGRVALHVEAARNGGDIRVLDLDRGAMSRLTLDVGSHSMVPVWTPDGRFILFTKRLGGSFAVHAKDATGVGDERLAYESKTAAGALLLGVSPDGRVLLVSEASSSGPGFDLAAMPVAGGAVSERYTGLLSRQAAAELSPDGRWLAYVSAASGRNEVYVQSFPKPDTRYQVSTNGGGHPKWRQDGRELFYRLPAGNIAAAMLAVGVERAGLGLKFGLPRKLFDLTGEVLLQHELPFYPYDVTRDGQRFLLTRQPSTGGISAVERPVTVVLNWDAALTGAQGR